jgi:hypothetical protein
MFYKNEGENTHVAHTPFMNLHTVMALTLNECRYKRLSVKMNEQQILNFTQPYNILFNLVHHRPT